MLGDNNAPAPYVPPSALTKPAGAAVDGQGQVSCVTCQVRLPLASADVVGMGYRCPPCSHRAEIVKLTGGGDAASHFTAEERRQLSTSGMITVFGGLGAIVVGALMVVLLFRRLGVAFVVGGISMIAVGFARREAAH